MNHDDVVCLVAEFLLGPNPLLVRPSLREFSALRCARKCYAVEKMLQDFAHLIFHKPESLQQALQTYVNAPLSWEAAVPLPEPSHQLLSSVQGSSCFGSLYLAPFRTGACVVSPHEKLPDELHAKGAERKPRTLEELIEARQNQGIPGTIEDCSSETYASWLVIKKI